MDDHEAIGQLAARYNRSFDDRDVDGWGDCFTPDARFEFVGAGYHADSRRRPPDGGVSSVAGDERTPRGMPDQPVGWLELFYDLVFVAAVITFSDAVSFDSHVESIGAVAAAFTALWLVWLASTNYSL